MRPAALVWSPSSGTARALTRASCAQKARVPLNEFEFPASKLAKVQSQLEHLVGKNYYLHQSAREAYRGCVPCPPCALLECRGSCGSHAFPGQPEEMH